MGKTTFINLITGLYFPSSGKILYDDLEILNSIEEWRNIVGFVPQNVFISNDTLKNNIAFGIKEYQIDNEKILKAIKLSGLNNFVESNSKGIELFWEKMDQNFQVDKDKELELQELFTRILNY